MAEVLHSRFQSGTSVALLLAALATPLCAADQTMIVGAGQSGNTLVAKVQNNADSAGAMQNVVVAVVAAPGFLSATDLTPV